MDGGSGLVFTEFRVDPLPPGFGSWHSGEHFGERLAVPGVRSARRYVAMDDPQTFLGYYRADRWDVFLSDAYRALASNPSEATKRVGSAVKGTRFLGEIAREARSGYGGYACRVRFTGGAESDQDRLDWFDRDGSAVLATAGISALALALPRRDLLNVDDANVIALIEGYDAEALELAGAATGASCRLFRLEHLLI